MLQGFVDPFFMMFSCKNREGKDLTELKERNGKEAASDHDDGIQTFESIAVGGSVACVSMLMDVFAMWKRRHLHCRSF